MISRGEGPTYMEEGTDEQMRRGEKEEFKEDKEESKTSEYQ